MAAGNPHDDGIDDDEHDNHDDDRHDVKQQFDDIEQLVE